MPRLLYLLLLTGALAPGQEAPTFRTGVSLVKVDVQVVQGQRLVGGLTRQDFRVLDRGQPREIVYFGQESEQLWVSLLLDVSGSMRKHVRAMAAAANKALSALRPGDQVEVVLFSREIKVFQPYTDDHSLVAGKLDAAVRHRSMPAGTSINSSILEAAQHMRNELANRLGRRAILILTDNEGWNYQVPDDRVLEALWQADAVLNAIVVGGAKRPQPLAPEVAANTDFTPSDVFQLAAETGGDVVRAKKAGEAFQTLLEGMRTRYSLHFHAAEGASGTFHEIQVELTGEAAKRLKRAKVRARRGYYLP